MKENKTEPNCRQDFVVRRAEGERPGLVQIWTQRWEAVFRRERKSVSFDRGRGESPVLFRPPGGSCVKNSSIPEGKCIGKEKGAVYT